MRRIKYLFWLVIAAILFTFVYQNRDFFIAQRDIGIDLYFFSYNSPEIPTGIYFLVVFAIGMLLSYFSNLSERFKNRKTIRQLNERISADEKRLNELDAELASRPTGGFPESASADTGEMAPH